MRFTHQRRQSSSVLTGVHGGFGDDRLSNGLQRLEEAVPGLSRSNSFNRRRA